MAGDDQERFEDYLELEHFIAELQAGHVVQPPQELTEAQARAYRMALLFHAATPGVCEPDAQFAEQLQARLEAEVQARRNRPASKSAQVSSGVPQRRRVLRRALLTGGAVAAASALVGVGVEQHLASQSSQADATLHVAGSPTNWFFVMNVADLANQAVKFVSDQMVGYVVRSDGTGGDPAKKGQIVAMSAACTHMGCIVDWSSEERRYHCPCHGGVFNEDGGIDLDVSSLYLRPLPRLDVKVEGGKIYVRVPSSM